jgi:hypothetical protein
VNLEGLPTTDRIPVPSTLPSLDIQAFTSMYIFIHERKTWIALNLTLAWWSQQSRTLEEFKIWNTSTWKYVDLPRQISGLTKDHKVLVGPFILFLMIRTILLVFLRKDTRMLVWSSSSPYFSWFLKSSVVVFVLWFAVTDRWLSCNIYPFEIGRIPVQVIHGPDVSLSSSILRQNSFTVEVKGISKSRVLYHTEILNGYLRKANPKRPMQESSRRWPLVSMMLYCGNHARVGPHSWFASASTSPQHGLRSSQSSPAIRNVYLFPANQQQSATVTSSEPIFTSLRWLLPIFRQTS